MRLTLNLAAACALAACTHGKTPSGATVASASDSPAIDAVCAHVAGVMRPSFEKAHGRRMSPEAIRASDAVCASDLRAERAEGEEHWRCLGACLLAAERPHKVDRCYDTCPRPALVLDCDSVLSVADVEKTIVGPVVRDDAAPATEPNAATCERGYAGADGASVELSVQLWNTRAEARGAVRRLPPLAEAVTPVVGLGDEAIQYQQPFANFVECTVAVAKGRKTAAVRVIGATCRWDANRRIASLAASRL